MTVPQLKFLVKVPNSMPLSVAAMLPTGALWAMNTIQVAREHILKILEEQGNPGIVDFIEWERKKTLYMQKFILL